MIPEMKIEIHQERPGDLGKPHQTLVHEIYHVQFVPGNGDTIIFSGNRYLVLKRVFDYTNGIIKLHCK